MEFDINALNKIEAEFKRNLQKAALYVKGKVKQNINSGQEYVRTKGPNGVYYHGRDPSQPGDYVKRVTGQLVRSIATAPSPDGNSWTVGSNLQYATYIEFGTSKAAPRKFLRATLEEERDNIIRIIASGKTT